MRKLIEQYVFHETPVSEILRKLSESTWMVD